MPKYTINSFRFLILDSTFGCFIDGSHKNQFFMCTDLDHSGLKSNKQSAALNVLKYNVLGAETRVSM